MEFQVGTLPKSHYLIENLQKRNSLRNVRTEVIALHAVELFCFRITFHKIESRSRQKTSSQKFHSKYN